MNNNIHTKKWIFLFLTTSAFFIGTIGLLNYLVDPYGLNHVIKVKKINFYKKSNTGYTFRFKSHAYRRGNFDTLMIGTSRIGVMNPEVINQMLNGKTFNFSSSGSITEIQKDLFYYGVNNHKIKNLIYGIDFLSLNGTIDPKKKFKTFYEMKDKLQQYKEIYNFDLYFNIDTFFDSYKVVKDNFLGRAKDSKKYLFKNGMRDYVDYIEEFENGIFNHSKHLEHSLKSYFPKKSKNTGYYNYKFSYKYLEHIREIVEYCKNNSINLWVYIPPMDKDHFDALFAYGVYDEFETLKRELLTVVEYVDFTGHNSINDNQENFWEGSHLKKELTPLVMGRVLNYGNSIPSDFGVLVTKENINSHLEKMRKSVKYYNIKNFSRVVE